MVPLPRRPGRGVWWNDRLYLTCLPSADTKGGLMSWAPGEPPRVEAPTGLFQGLVGTDEGLLLEPVATGQQTGVARRLVKQGWTYVPGQRASTRPLGPDGACGGVASAEGWTARAYPQADCVVIEGPTGRTVRMRCYDPLRLAWAGTSLVVSTREGDTQLYQDMLPTLIETHS